MDVAKIISELRSEREDIERAILSLEQVAAKHARERYPVIPPTHPRIPPTTPIFMSAPLARQAPGLEERKKVRPCSRQSSVSRTGPSY